jgi:hypothetical protein
VIEVFEEIEQGSDAWRKLRAGLPTASEFHDVIAKVGPRGGIPKGRQKLLWRLAGEIITGEPEDTYQNADMLRGHEREAEARDYYAFLYDVDPKRVAFIRNGNCGASPDSLIGEEGLLEIKDAKPSVQIERLIAGTLPSEHKAQCQGQLMVSGRRWVDFMSHSRGLPPFVTRVERDEKYIAELREGVDRFVAELEVLVNWIRAMQ